MEHFDTILWLLFGLAGGGLLIKFAKGRAEQEQINIFGVALVIAALIYIGFAVLYGASTTWLFIETVGVLIYGSSYLLAKHFGLHFLALGWLLHPVWDVGLHLVGAGGHFAPEWYAVMCISFDLVVAVYLFRKSALFKGAVQS
ncbi:DUF6010 family protein [Neptuniibacter sp. QD34_54]|uniref:DUF6010 family protein n=1 Tax=unclassified Neptuniibacter TaxID=2630693 RepID=UPI0039F6EC8B